MTAGERAEARRALIRRKRFLESAKRQQRYDGGNIQALVQEIAQVDRQLKALEE